MTAYLQELFSFGLHKKNQGKIARQGTFFALALAVAVGSYSLKNELDAYDATLPDQPTLAALENDQAAYEAAMEKHEANVASLESWEHSVHNAAVPVMFAMFALGGWAAFRLIQLPVFADFLISVEAEMNKVTWPKQAELIKASVVVILTIFVLAALLYMYDLVWKYLLDLILSIGAGK